MGALASRFPLIRILQVAMAVGLLVLVWRVADGADALQHLASADPFWIAAAIAALTLQTVLSSMRWRLTAARLGLEFDRGTAVREYYLSQIVNQVLPGGVLGDAGRALRARAQAGLLVSGQAVVFERLAGQLALLSVLVTALAATQAVPGGSDWPGLPLPAAALSVLAMIVCTATAWAIVRRGAGRPGHALARLGHDLARAFAAPEVRWRQLGLSLGTAFCNIAAFGFCAAAIGAHLPVTAALVLVPLILLAMVVPLTISGWGLREGAAAALFPLAGATAAEGLAAGIAFGFVFLAASLPGLAFAGASPAVGTTRP